MIKRVKLVRDFLGDNWCAPGKVIHADGYLWVCGNTLANWMEIDSDVRELWACASKTNPKDGKAFRCTTYDDWESNYINVVALDGTVNKVYVSYSLHNFVRDYGPWLWAEIE